MIDKLSIVLENGVNLLEGPIDEYADLEPLRKSKPPLRLDLKGITKINSIGIAKWLKLIKAWDNLPIEFHNVSHVMISSANIMPMFFNLKDPVKKVKSLLIPYFCEHCDEPYEIFCNDFELVFKRDDVVPPNKICSNCGRGLELDVDDDFFEFYMDLNV